MDRLLSRLGKSKSLIDFEITIHRVELSIPNSRILKICWERRKKCAETQEFIISSDDSSVSLQASLFMSNTLYSKNSEYLEKLAKLKLKQKVRNDWITLSDLTLDLSHYILKPLKNHDFFFSFNSSRCKVTLSLQSHNTKETEIYCIEKNIMDTREKFESILKNFNERQEEVDFLKKEVETLSKSLEDTKNNRNENYLEAEQ
jgi:galactokinase